MKKKIYFVAETTIGGRTIQTEKFNQIIDQNTGKVIFDEVFQFTENTDFDVYEHKEEFLSVALLMCCEYFESFGQISEEICLTAIDEETNIFQWGIKILLTDEDNFQYMIFSWKSNDYVVKLDE